MPSTPTVSPPLAAVRSAVLCALAIAFCLAGAPGCGRREQPDRISGASGVPYAPSLHDGSWYWISKERGAPARLVRAGNGAPAVVVQADDVASYDVSGQHLVVLVLRGRERSVETGPASGGDLQGVWRGSDRPGDARFVGDAVCWAETAPAAVPGGSALPPLAARTRILSAPPAGGPPTVVAELLESGRVSILGAHGGAIYAAAYRPGAPGSVAVYRVLRGTRPERVAGEYGSPPMLLARDGTLYWAAQSRESSNVSSIACIRRLVPGGRPENLSDWLPGGGALYETDRGVLYADGGYTSALWPVGRNDAFPEPLHTPAGYLALAAGGGEALLGRFSEPRRPLALYRSGL